MTNLRGTTPTPGLRPSIGHPPMVLVVCGRDCRADADWASLQDDGVRLLHVADMDDALAVLIVEPRLDAIVIQGPMPSLANHTLDRWMDVIPPGASMLVAGSDGASKSTLKIRALVAH